jgi:hypothetical protein
MHSVPPATRRGFEALLAEKVVDEEAFLAENVVDAANLDSQTNLRLPVIPAIALRPQ